MKKIIVLMLVSIATQNLNASDWLRDDFASLSGRPQSPARGCATGTKDWIGGDGPMQSLEDVTRAWLATPAGKVYLAGKAQKKERREKGQDELTRKRRKTTGNLFPDIDGYDTPSPEEDREHPLSPSSRTPTPLPVK